MTVQRSRPAESGGGFLSGIHLIRGALNRATVRHEVDAAQRH